MANKLKDCSPDDRAQAIIIAGNCRMLQAIENLVADGQLDEAMKLITQALHSNFACLLALSVKCGTDGDSSMEEAQELLDAR